MNKYVNGQLKEMTEKDIARRNTRFAARNKNITDVSDAKVKELESAVATLMRKLEEQTATAADGE